MDGSQPTAGVEARLKAVLDAAPDAMVVTDRLGRIVIVSAEAEKLFGYEARELLGKPVEVLMPERFRAAHPGHRNRYFLDPHARVMGAAGMELFGLRKDGTEFPAEISLSPLETEDGIMAITAIRDVTARKKADALLRGVIEAAPDAMLITDRRGRIMLVNAQAERLFGYTRDELLGQVVEALIPQRFRGSHPAHRAAYFSSPRPRPMGAGGLELFGLRKDGTEFPAEISLGPLDTEGGRISITAIREITERKQAEEERARLHARLEAAMAELAASYEKARELERLKTQFFANVSHELRTPLTLILGPAEKLLAAPGLSEEPRHDLEVIARNARTLAKHVNDLLDVARLEAGKMALEAVPADAAQLVRLVAAHFESLAAQRGMELAVETPPSLVRCLDAAKLQRVLFNLLSNAFKFAPAGGRVRCSLRAGEGPGAPLELEVADSGPGIPPAQREAVFARFTQLENEATRRWGGTGLGLAIAKEFVELHGGSIRADQAPEGGALFRAVLPVPAPAEVARPAALEAGDGYGAGAVEELRSRDVPAVPATEGARSRVLLVEDNPEMTRFLAGVLAADFEVSTAPDGRAGLEAALARPPDAIVTDLMMPRMGGEELVRAVRAEERLAGVPILVMTAKADDDVRVRLLRGGAQDYVMKPFLAEEVRARVQNLVSAKVAREVLQRELDSHTHDLAALAGEVAARKRELEVALEATRLAREEAEYASAAKTRFLRLVSHELRTPLTALRLHLQRMPRGEAPLSERRQEILRRMTLSSSRLTALIESLLHQAQIASGRLTVQEQDVDVQALARTALEGLRPEAEDKGLALRIRAADHVPWVKTDPRFLEIILANLVGNAVKFTQAGAVEVVVEASSDEVRLGVADSGPGIPAEDSQRMFEPFERGQRAVEEIVPGLGLGLAVVRDLAAAIGARVELRPGLGSGTTFTVALPRARAGRGVAVSLSSGAGPAS